jgi:hypothetical protein
MAAEQQHQQPPNRGGRQGSWDSGDVKGNEGARLKKGEGVNMVKTRREIEREKLGEPDLDRKPINIPNIHANGKELLGEFVVVKRNGSPFLSGRSHN